MFCFFTKKSPVCCDQACYEREDMSSKGHPFDYASAKSCFPYNDPMTPSTEVGSVVIFTDIVSAILLTLLIRPERVTFSHYFGNSK